MLFTSATFVFFHIIAVTLRWAFPARWTSTVLLFSSAAFYLTWGPLYGVLLLAVVCVGYGTGLALERWGPRKLCVGLAVGVLLAVLGYFKYTHFLIQLVSPLCSQWRGKAPFAQPVLPLAISFYTFEVISYVVDVYRGGRAERSFLRLALYIAYYPHLIAGPIVRPSELLPQLRVFPPFDTTMVTEGMSLMMRGFIKKLIFADRFAAWSDKVFAAPLDFSSGAVWWGVLAYTGQIYCDFSGYTDIARGASLTLGIRLPDNFALPYLSFSITEFWRRWHMTLSRWLRDYLYVPLGGNRGSRWFQARNLMITMALGGLWHGARWTFVVWGLWHGLLLVLHKRWQDWSRLRPRWEILRAQGWYKAGAMLLTFVAVMMGWVCFRADSFDKAQQVLERLWAWPTSLWLPQTWPLELKTTMVLWSFLIIGHIIGARGWEVRLRERLPAPALGLAWALAVLCCYVYADPREQFIYFQF